MSTDDAEKRTTGRRESDPDLVAIGSKLDALVDLLKQQNEQNKRAAEMLREEFHENRKLGRELVAVLIDLQIERDHQQGANGRIERLEQLSATLVKANGNADGT